MRNRIAWAMDAPRVTDRIRKLRPDQFQELANMLFYNLGYKIEKSASKDGVVQMIISREETYYWILKKRVKERRYFVNFRRDMIREFSMSDVEKFAREAAAAGCGRYGFIVNTGSFSQDALELADNWLFELVDNIDLIGYLKKAKLDINDFTNNS